MLYKIDEKYPSLNQHYRQEYNNYCEKKEMVTREKLMKLDYVIKHAFELNQLLDKMVR